MLFRSAKAELERRLEDVNRRKSKCESFLRSTSEEPVLTLFSSRMLLSLSSPVLAAFAPLAVYLSLPSLWSLDLYQTPARLFPLLPFRIPPPSPSWNVDSSAEEERVDP